MARNKTSRGGLRGVPKVPATRKERSDATPFDRYRESLEQWLYLENRSYDEALALLQSEHGFSAKKTALWAWRQRRDQERLLERITTSARNSAQVAARFAEENPQVETGFVQMLKQVAFDLLSSPNPDPTAIAQIAGQALKLRDQELKSETLALQRDRFQFSAAEACLAHLPSLKAIAADSSLDSSAKVEAIRNRLFGPAPTLPTAANPALTA